MLKKYTFIVLMLTAYVILLAHNIIPHHHHHNNQDLTEHHQVNHHNDDDHEHTGLNHLFSLLIHPADGFTSITNHSIISTLFRQMLAGVAVMPGNFYLGQLPIPPLPHCRSSDHPIYIPPHSYSSGLRAPPAIFI